MQYGPGLGDVIAAGDSDGRIHFICAQTGEKILCPLTGHTHRVTGVSWSPDSTRLASGSLDKTVRLWDASTGAPIGSPLRGHSKDNEECTCKHDAGLLQNRYEANPDCPVNVDAGLHGVQSISFSPKGDMVAAGCYNGNIFFVDAAAGEIKSSLNVGYAFSRCSTRISVPALPLFSRFSTRISV